jgi:hypothetical protein
MTVHEFGQTTIEIEGIDPISTYLRSEFTCLPVSDDAPQIICRRVDTLPPSSQFSHSFGRVSLGDDGYRIEFGAWIAQLTLTGNTVLAEFATKAPTKLSRYPDIWQRARNWNHLNVNEEIAKGVIYDVLDQAVQIQQLTQGQTFVHCSAIESDGEVDVIAGWGGAGKTSSVMDLVLNDRYRFLSDDLGILHSSGTFYRSPKRIQIYPYNLEGSPRLEESLMSGRNFADKLLWRVRKARRGAKGVRRRVSAEEFFGAENVAVKGNVRRFIHLERSTNTTPEWRTVTPEAMALRTSHVLVHELNPLNEIGTASSAGSLVSPFATESWRSASETHVAAALSNVPCIELRVPMKTSPSELSDLLRKIKP